MEQKDRDEAEKSSDRKQGREEVTEHLQCSHVVQGQVQLLTESLAL